MPRSAITAQQATCCDAFTDTVFGQKVGHVHAQHWEYVCVQAADGEVIRLQQSMEVVKQDSQKGLIEMRKATQQWAVAQADLRSSRHQLKVLQQQVGQQGHHLALIRLTAAIGGAQSCSLLGLSPVWPIVVLSRAWKTSSVQCSLPSCNAALFGRHAWTQFAQHALA